MPRCSPRRLHRYGDLIVRSPAVRDSLTARPDADVAGMLKAGIAMKDHAALKRAIGDGKVDAVFEEVK